MLRLTLFATEVSLHDQNRPPNSCTPMMAKMRKNRPTTMDTLAMDASDRVTERKTSIMPGLRVRVLQVSHYSVPDCYNVNNAFRRKTLLHAVDTIRAAVGMPEQPSPKRLEMGRVSTMIHTVSELIIESMQFVTVVTLCRACTGEWRAHESMTA